MAKGLEEVDLFVDPAPYLESTDIALTVHEWHVVPCQTNVYIHITFFFHIISAWLVRTTLPPLVVKDTNILGINSSDKLND